MKRTSTGDIQSATGGETFKRITRPPDFFSHHCAPLRALKKRDTAAASAVVRKRLRGRICRSREMASVGDFDSAPTEGRFEPTPRLRRCRYPYITCRVLHVVALAQCPMRRAVDLHCRWTCTCDIKVKMVGLFNGPFSRETTRPCWEMAWRFWFLTRLMLVETIRMKLVPRT
jgi:hypothetical protein